MSIVWQEEQALVVGVGVGIGVGVVGCEMGDLQHSQSIVVSWLEGTTYLEIEEQRPWASVIEKLYAFLD